MYKNLCPGDVHLAMYDILTGIEIEIEIDIIKIKHYNKIKRSIQVIKYYRNKQSQISISYI